MKTRSIAHWKVMTFYQKFEQLVALILTFIISVVIIVSVARLSVEVFTLLIDGVIDPMKPRSFQTVFGMIMTVLIAMEFKHSILKVVAREDSIIQVKTVIIISLLAIIRKFIIIDTYTHSPPLILALSGAVLAMGLVYWLMKERDERLNA